MNQYSPVGIVENRIHQSHMLESVVIPPTFLERMIESARGAIPNECCGIVGGKGSVITSVHPLTNDLASPDGFFTNPKELFKAVKRMRKTGEEMVGIFHSHPQGSATPSQKDSDENLYPGLYYFIISFNGDEAIVRCFVMSENKEFKSVTII